MTYKNRPQRTREHRLQAESKTAFQDKLDQLGWIYEFTSGEDDYGLDGRIEIFDEDGYTTGKRFFCQLKGTDEPVLKKALACKLKVEKFEYYRSLDLPVLIVRYHSPTRKIYVKWFHTYDPYYGRNAQKGFTFRLSEEDEWQEKTAIELIANLDAFNLLWSSRFQPPVNLSINFEQDRIQGLFSIEIEIELHKIIEEKINRLVHISPSYSLDQGNHGTITVRKKKIEIYLHSGTGFTLHNYELNQTRDLSVLCYDILIGIAVALEKTDQSNIAAQIIAEIGAYSSIINYRDILLISVHCMAHANRIIEALQLAEELIETRDLVATSQILSLVAQTQREKLLEKEKIYLQSFLKLCIDKALKQENDDLIATAHYNYGNYQKTKQPQSKTDLRLALHHYKTASKFDLTYWDEPYFCREIAGILFESQRYALSAKLYKYAIDLGEEGICQALYADALMLAGEYHIALQAFRTYFSSDVESEPEYKLKAFALEKICSLFKIEKQKRKTIEAVQLSALDDNLSPSEYRGKLYEALNHDSLCSNAWFNLGVLEYQLEHKESAMFSFLFAAIINKNNLEAWCNAIGIGLLTDKYTLLQDMIYVAQQNHKNNFMAQMIKDVQNQGDDFPINQILNLLYETAGKVSSIKNQFTIRYKSH